MALIVVKFVITVKQSAKLFFLNLTSCQTWVTYSLFYVEYLIYFYCIFMHSDVVFGIIISISVVNCRTIIIIQLRLIHMSLNFLFCSCITEWRSGHGTVYENWFFIRWRNKLGKLVRVFISGFSQCSLSTQQLFVLLFVVFMDKVLFNFVN